MTKLENAEARKVIELRFVFVNDDHEYTVCLIDLTVSGKKCYLRW